MKLSTCTSVVRSLDVNRFDFLDTLAPRYHFYFLPNPGLSGTLTWAAAIPASLALNSLL